MRVEKTRRHKAVGGVDYLRALDERLVPAAVTVPWQDRRDTDTLDQDVRGERYAVRAICVQQQAAFDEGAAWRGGSHAQALICGVGRKSQRPAR